MARLSLLIILTLFSTATQAQEADLTRGGAVFGEHCTRCHLPVDIEQRLKNDWYGHSAAELLEIISTTMPGEKADSSGVKTLTRSSSPSCISNR